MNSTENAEPQPTVPHGAWEWRDRNFPGGRSRRGLRPLRAVGFAAMIVLCIFLFGYVTEHLWNWLMPSIFHLRTVTFVEAIGLVVLGKILFGGIHKGGYRGGGRRGGPGSRHWKQHMKARFESMTPEEREKFRSGMRGRRWNCGPTRPEVPRPETTQGDR